MSLQALLTWAKENGTFVDNSVSFKEIPGRGIAAVANGNTPAGKEMIRVPETIFLTPQMAREYFGGSCDRNQLLQLLLAKLKFDTEPTIVGGVDLSEKMRPYLNFLPAEGKGTGLPYFWNEEEKDMLKGTDAEVFLQRYTDAIVEEWHKASPSPDEQFYKDYKKGNYHKGMYYFLAQPISDWTAFPAYLWAHCIFASRAFPYLLIDAAAPPHKAFLLPVIDLLNHENNAQVKWKYEDGSLLFKTMESSSASGELFNNYGDKSNAQLLLGYGFVLPENEFDTATLSLKVAEPVVQGARNFGVQLPAEASAQGINFVLSHETPVPPELVDFFAYVVRLSSEDGVYTTRMRLEGLANLRAILDTKVDVFRKFKLQVDRSTSPYVLPTIKRYRNSQKLMFQTALDTTLKLEKQALKKFKPLSFKKVLKNDKTFFNSLLLTFGVMNYGELVAKNLLDAAVLLWIVRNANSEPSDLFPEYIAQTFAEVKRSVPVTPQDVKEFGPIYKKLFPALSQQIPEVYGVGDWSPRSFIVAGTVSDRLTFKRPSNDEVLFLKKEDYRGYR